MALVIEDGSLVAGANSFISRADYITQAAEIGVTIADAAAADIELVKAAQFIASHEDNLKGYKVNRDQAMSFPRHNLYIDGFWWEYTEIPTQVIDLQVAIALEINSGIDPYNPPVNTERATRRERIEGAVEVEYFGKDGDAITNRRSKTISLLYSLLDNVSLFSIGMVRA